MQIGIVVRDIDAANDPGVLLEIASAVPRSAKGFPASMSSAARGGLVCMCARMLLIHGAADTGWSFHRLAAELEHGGHAVASPDELAAALDALV